MLGRRVIGGPRRRAIARRTSAGGAVAFADYFVAPGGSDLAVGSLEAPFATIQHAVSAAIAAGGSRTIRVRGGTYRETVTLTGWGGTSGARQRLLSYPGETPIISGSEVVTGWARCGAGDAAVIGATLGVEGSPVWKATVARSAIGSSALAGANLREAGVQVAVVSDRASTGFSPLVQSDNRDFHVPTSFTTDGGGDVDTITSIVFGGYSEAQLQRCVLIGYGSPNVVFHSAITSASGDTVTLASPYPPQAGPSTAFNLVNALPALVAGRWGYTDNGDSTVTLYLYPTNEANLAGNIEIGARTLGISVGAAPWVTIDGFIIEGQGGGTTTQSCGIASIAALDFDGLTVTNCTVRRTMNFTRDGGYGAIYLRQASNAVIDGCTLEDIYGQYGLLLTASSGTSGSNRVSECSALRVEKSPWRLYGQDTTLVAYCTATDCGMSAHANKANTYEQNRNVTFWGLRFVRCEGYGTWQEGSRIRWGMSEIPSGSDGRSITNQQNGTEPPDNASTHTIINVCAPISSTADPSYGSIVATGSLAPAADETTEVFNCVLSGISLGSSGTLVASRNVFIDSRGSVSPGAFDLVADPEDVFTAPATDDFTLAPGSILIGAGGVDRDDWLVALEAEYGYNLHRDVNGTPFARLDFIGCYAAARVADTTAPVLSAVSAEATAGTDISVSLTTDTAVGGIWWVATASSTAPTAAQVAAGQDHTGSAALVAGVYKVTAIGTLSLPLTGFDPDTTYHLHLCHEDLHGNRSTVASTSTTTPAAAEFFTMSATGPVFVDPEDIPANTTAMEYEVRMQLSAPFPNGTIALVAAQASTGCDLRPIGSTTTTRWTVVAEDGGGTNMISSTGNGSTGVALPVGEWFTANLLVDQVAGTARLLQGGVEVWSTTFTPALAYFQTIRRLSILGNTGGGNRLPEGVQIEYVRIWLTTGGTRTLRKEIAGNAVTVNADPWKLPASGDAI